MQLRKLETKVRTMTDSEFFKTDELKFIEEKILSFVNKINDYFGDNDGEALDEDGIAFVVELLRLRMLEANGVFEE